MVGKRREGKRREEKRKKVEKRGRKRDGPNDRSETEKERNTAASTRVFFWPSTKPSFPLTTLSQSV